jgi:hypothetical protein
LVVFLGVTLPSSLCCLAFFFFFVVFFLGVGVVVVVVVAVAPPGLPAPSRSSSSSMTASSSRDSDSRRKPSALGKSRARVARRLPESAFSPARHWVAAACTAADVSTATTTAAALVSEKVIPGHPTNLILILGRTKIGYK